jgi:hypothetical protein
VGFDGTRCICGESNFLVLEREREGELENRSL